MWGFGLTPTIRSRASCHKSHLLTCGFNFSDEQEAVQKRTFTKWINSHLAKVRAISFFPFLFMLRTAFARHIHHKSPNGVRRISQAHRASAKQIVRAITSHPQVGGCCPFFVSGVVICCRPLVMMWILIGQCCFRRSRRGNRQLEKLCPAAKLAFSNSVHDQRTERMCCV